MRNEQAVLGASRDAVRIALRTVCYFSSALLFYGCSMPPSIVPMPSDEPLPVVAVSSTSLVEVPTPAPPVSEKATHSPESEENNIFFAPRLVIVDDMEKEKLQRHADRLKSNHKEIVSLKGYSDNQGSRNYNLAITEERLMAVEKLLLSYGVSPRQIRRNRSDSVKAPRPCTTPECRQRMRRVELEYSP